MSKEAEDLINRMIQLEPQHRLGHNLESIKMLKQHPFFNGIKFAEVSTPGFKGIKPLVEAVLPQSTSLDFNMSLEDLNRQSMMNTTGDTYKDLLDNNPKVHFKGLLIKKNWYGNKQLRFFVLYTNGEIKYYKDMKEFKGSITVGGGSKVRKTGRTTMNVFCIKK